MFKIAWKELRQLQRNPLVLIIALVMPGVMMGAACLAFSGELKSLPVGLVNEDDGDSGYNLVRIIHSDSTFHVVWESTQYDRARIFGALEDGQVRAVIFIPQGFSADLPLGQAKVYVYIDGSDVLAAEAVSRGIEQESSFLMNRPSVEMIQFALFSPKLSYENYIVPAIYGMFLMSFPLMLQAMAISGEREKQTIEQLIVTPIGKMEILGGKLLVYFVIGLSNASSMLFIMTAVFGLRLSGDPIGVVLVSVTFLLANLGIGTLGSVIAKNQLQAMQILLPLIYTSLFFTGTFYPVETLPSVIRPLAYLLPLTYMNHSIRLLMKGASLGSVLGDIVFLAVFAATFLIIASVLFQKRLQ